MMKDDDIRSIIKQMALFHQSGAISGEAFAWIAESLIASSGVDDRDEQLSDLGEYLGGIFSIWR